MFLLRISAQLQPGYSISPSTSGRQPVEFGAHRIAQGQALARMIAVVVSRYVDTSLNMRL